eukprot:5551075-Pyramimonas_sp.AAC.1
MSSARWMPRHPLDPTSDGPDRTSARWMPKGMWVASSLKWCQRTRATASGMAKSSAAIITTCMRRLCRRSGRRSSSSQGSSARCRGVASPLSRPPSSDRPAWKSSMLFSSASYSPAHAPPQPPNLANVLTRTGDAETVDGAEQLARRLRVERVMNIAAV